MNQDGLIDQLRKANLELANAYDETIEGWMRALELRDRNTAGHSLRVTALTLRLASKMGFEGEQLMHVRRGSLLHDIGMLAIPDAILFKPGTLTSEEWAIMQQHPTLGYQILSPIAYLRPALEIVYCHHERWNGKGYPRGLKGEQIPLVARLFAVVDVWDALLTDHAYRRAWPLENAVIYCREKAGLDFDPKVVDVFLATLEV